MLHTPLYIDFIFDCMYIRVNVAVHIIAVVEVLELKMLKITC